MFRRRQTVTVVSARRSRLGCLIAALILLFVIGGLVLTAVLFGPGLIAALNMPMDFSSALAGIAAVVVPLVIIFCVMLVLIDG